ncbi:MAG: high frequency lysogenization protein HflD [Geobacter sp.]|nr:MAG: high frequency lysogenization protein HflD [Geobacter sp.]
MQTANFGIFSIYVAAFILGAAHSLEPGHGKTVVAAYLVGSRGRNIDAVILGLVVTFTHTFSIIVLGLIAKFSSRYFSEQELHGYLGIVASLIILAIGLWMLRSRWLGMRDPSRAHHHTHLFGSHHHHDHSHDHDHDHSHDHDHGHNHSHDDSHAHSHDQDHDHGSDHGHSHAPASGQPLGAWGLILLGISGGIVPCPAALAILLASASVGDMGKGLALVLIFSTGLALALVAIGLAVVNSVRMTSRFIDTERYAPYAAVASAVIVTLVGAFTLYSSLTHFYMA